MIRGELLAGARLGQHAWQALRLATDGVPALVTATARRAAELAGQAGDLGNAEWALRRGLALLPGAESLWRELLRVRASHQPGSVRAVTDEMFSALGRRAGVAAVEPETAVLLARLAPAADAGLA
jgi:hypothetical protein